jgi:putative glutamine amidotransferase
MAPGLRHEAAMGKRSTPVVGLTLDAEPAGGWAKLPWYALRQNYFGAVAEAGGLPIALPHLPALAGNYLDGIDALLVTGGAFDVDPKLFGATTRHASVSLKEARTEFELAILRGALARDLPVLGICGGQQLLNVVLGGTLIQHIPDAVPNALAHEQPNPRTEPGHAVAIDPGSRLAAIVQATAMQVNSAHHQAADDVGAGIAVTARAPDGVIEAIEDPRRRFCIGVQWHPEYHVDPGDRRIFGALVDAAR